MRLKNSNRRLSAFEDVFKTRVTGKEKRIAVQLQMSPRHKGESKTTIPSPKAEIEPEGSLDGYYDKATRTYKKSWLGEIKLPKTEYYLVEPTHGLPVFTPKPSMLPVLQLETKQDPFATPRKYKKKFKFALKNKLPSLATFDYSTVPYDRPKAREFIHACKNNDVRQLHGLLMQDKHLVVVFDRLNMTGLHWAALRNHVETVKLLIASGADVNATDLVICSQSCRTPLALAAKSDNIPVVKLLLRARADPYIPSSSSKLPINCAKSPQCQALIKKSMMVKSTQVHSLMNFSPKAWTQEIWEKQTTEFAE